jgi:hypothetical protein
VTSASHRFRPYVVKTAGILVGVAMAVFCGWLLASCRAARATCVEFVAAVREERLADARALVIPELAPVLAGLPDTEPARALGRIRASRNGDLGIVQSGFKNADFVPFSCFDGGDETTPFWIVAARVGDTFRVVDLRTTTPEICEGSH